MAFIDLKNFIDNNLVDKSKKHLSFIRSRITSIYLEKNYPDLYNLLIEHTNYLPDKSSIAARLVCILRGYTKQPVCRCGNPTKYQKSKKDFATFCSIKCNFATSLLQKNLIEYNIKKYGVAHHWLTKEGQDKRLKTINKNYGVNYPTQSEEIKNKVKNTNIKKYGGNAPICNNKIKNKILNTVIVKYKVDNVLKNSEIKSKIEKTNILKYGYKNPVQSEEIKNKIKKTWTDKTESEQNCIKNKRKNTCINIYGVDNVSKNKIIKNKIQLKYKNKSKEQIKEEQEKARLTRKLRYGVYNCNTQHINLKIQQFRENTEKYIKWLRIQHYTLKKSQYEIAQLLGIDPSTISNDFIRYGLITTYFYSSSVERDIDCFIKSLGNTTISRDRTATGKELDIYIPDKKLAIEIDGLYWHSHSSIPPINIRNLHRDKTRICKNNNIKLFHIYDCEWLDPIKQDIWKSILTVNLGGKIDTVYARNTKILEISHSISVNFFNNNHIQGHCKSSKYLGLYHGNNLIAAMSFTKERCSSKWYLTRFCNKKYTRVVGGASKLLNYFKIKFSWSEIITYADLRYSYGELYYTLGFSLVKELGISYYYTDKKTIIHKRNFQKQYLSYILGDKYNPADTEVNNVLRSGKYRILFDSGKLKFNLTR